MPEPEILKRGQRISAAHYEGVTRMAYRDVISSAGSDRSDNYTNIDKTQVLTSALFKLDERSSIKTLEGNPEPYASAMAKRITINPVTQVATEAESDALIRIVFPLKGSRRAASRQKGEIVVAHYAPKCAAWIADAESRKPDVWIENGTGSTLTAGKIVGIGSPKITTIGDAAFQSDTTFMAVSPPTATHRMGGWAMLLDDCPNGEIVGGVNSGIVIAQVNIRHASNTFVDVKASDGDKFNSSEWGWGKILWKESGTGLKWARVDFNRHETEFIGKSVGTLVHGTTGTVEQYYDPATAVGINEDVLHDWMTGGVDIPDDKEVQVRWFSNKGVLRIVNAEC